MDVNAVVARRKQIRRRVAELLELEQRQREVNAKTHIIVNTALQQRLTQVLKGSPIESIIDLDEWNNTITIKLINHPNITKNRGLYKQHGYKVRKILEQNEITIKMREPDALSSELRLISALVTFPSDISPIDKDGSGKSAMEIFYMQNSELPYNKGYQLNFSVEKSEDSQFHKWLISINKTKTFDQKEEIQDDRHIMSSFLPDLVNVIMKYLTQRSSKAHTILLNAKS